MSKGSEALNSIIIGSLTVWEFEKNVDVIAKELKALEIIKTKRVNVVIFLGCDNLEEYNKHPLSCWKLTKEEFDLLKEVLL